MNSLPDVEQVKCKSVNKGQQAVRVYRMVQYTTTNGEKAVMSLLLKSYSNTEYLFKFSEPG